MPIGILNEASVKIPYFSQ